MTLKAAGLDTVEMPKPGTRGSKSSDRRFRPWRAPSARCWAARSRAKAARSALLKPDRGVGACFALIPRTRRWPLCAVQSQASGRSSLRRRTSRSGRGQLATKCAASEADQFTGPVADHESAAGCRSADKHFVRPNALPMKDVIKLTTGSIVELNRRVNEPVEVLVNQCLIARGEVVVVEGNYGVRILEIASRQDRIRSLR